MSALAAARPGRALVPAFLLVALFAAGAAATPYWTAEDEARSPAEAFAPRRPAMPPVDGYDYPAEFVRTANFLGTLQVENVLDPEFGGEQEAEHLLTIVQSDNTSEVVWVWSTLASAYGVDSLLYRAADAWTYLGNFPAYNEEGGSHPDSGYYRVYNCGWALRAEMAWRHATGDSSKRAYGDSCAAYLMANPLRLHAGPPSGFYGRLNGAVEAWAMGNLYDYGLDVGNPAYLAAAAATADSIRSWVEEDSTRLRQTVWAMSGGATMWGLVRSYFAAHPAEAGPWLARFAPMLATTVGGGQFANAWNGWNALGHWAVYEATGSAAELALHQAVTDSLLVKDTDGDGGIPARYVDTSAQDQSWVSSYLAFMGLDRRRQWLTSVAQGPDAGAPLPARAAPNPSRGETRFSFHHPRDGRVRAEVFDARGRRVWMRDAIRLEGGRQSLAWDGRGPDAARVAPGLYLFRATFEDGAGQASGKVLLLP